MVCLCFFLLLLICIASILPGLQEDINHSPSFLELLVEQLRDLKSTNEAKLRATNVIVGVLRLENLPEKRAVIQNYRRQSLQNYLTTLDLPVAAISMNISIFFVDA